MKILKVLPWFMPGLLTGPIGALLSYVIIRYDAKTNFINESGAIGTVISLSCFVGPLIVALVVISPFLMKHNPDGSGYIGLKGIGMIVTNILFYAAGLIITNNFLPKVVLEMP